MFQPVAPARFCYETLNSLDKVVSSSSDVLTRNTLKRVPDGDPNRISGIEIDGAVHVVFGDKAKEPFYEIPMGVEHGHSIAASDVGQYHVL